jgi:hypothetical protein
MSEVPSAPSLAEDPLTRLWEQADASHGHHIDAVADLRERKRRVQDAPRRVKAVPAGERVECERCRQTVDRASSEPVAIPSPVAEPAQHLLCSRCADEVRLGLLRLLAGEEPLPARSETEQDVPLTIPTRVGWFVVRLTIYALIGLAVFALVSWLSER